MATVCYTAIEYCTVERQKSVFYVLLSVCCNKFTGSIELWSTEGSKTDPTELQMSLM